jgi:hypothetical protein
MEMVLLLELHRHHGGIDQRYRHRIREHQQVRPLAVRKTVSEMQLTEQIIYEQNDLFYFFILFCFVAAF